VCGAQRSQIQFEDEDHAFYMSFRWVTTTCLRWEPQPVDALIVPSVCWPRYRVCLVFYGIHCRVLLQRGDWLGVLLPVFLVHIGLALEALRQGMEQSTLLDVTGKAGYLDRFCKTVFFYLF